MHLTTREVGCMCACWGKAHEGEDCDVLPEGPLDGQEGSHGGIHTRRCCPQQCSQQSRHRHRLGPRRRGRPRPRAAHHVAAGDEQQADPQ